MRKTSLLCAALLLAAACASGPSSTGAQERTVLVDYQHDEFATAMLLYYPRNVQVHPGDTVTFKQTWTGEPHSVTMGTLVDSYISAVEPFRQKQERGEPIPEDPPAEIMELEKPLPWMFGKDGVAQNAAQPCYLPEGTPPSDEATPCPEDKQRQPEFTGTYSFYNSGFIAYEGQNGNTFKVKVAKTTKPGIYSYYCNLHGAFMSGTIEVVDKAKPIPSQAKVNAQARKEINKSISSLGAGWKKIKAGKLELPPEASALLEPGAKYFKGNLAGYTSEEAHGIINEFYPKTMTVKAGEKITWTMIGAHTVSFNVPKYFPIIQVRKDRSVVRNDKLDPAAGGAPAVPEGDPFERSEPLVIDAGPFGGKDFYSSGLLGSDPYAQWSVTLTKPGTYQYACLVHPPMIGSIKVV